eukprot:scaffold529651_cov36-Prasinocladus_malaysianus.AAC.1
MCPISAGRTRVVESLDWPRWSLTRKEFANTFRAYAIPYVHNPHRPSNVRSQRSDDIAALNDHVYQIQLLMVVDSTGRQLLLTTVCQELSQLGTPWSTGGNQGPHDGFLPFVTAKARACHLLPRRCLRRAVCPGLGPGAVPVASDGFQIEEVKFMRQAFEELQAGYQPPVTFVVVQKRHLTRFFPMPGEGDRK